MYWKKGLKRLWHFIWEDNSVWSWIANIALAFVLIKFVAYPLLGLVLSTSYPVVAVVSESMEHNNNFDAWWEKSGNWYYENGISRGNFSQFALKDGFDKGDIMVLHGKKPQDVRIGDIIVFWSAGKEPIIHRVVRKWRDNGIYYFQTKGDNNIGSIKNKFLDETKVSETQVVGSAVLRIPLLGYIKIWFVELLGMINAVLQKG